MSRRFGGKKEGISVFEVLWILEQKGYSDYLGGKEAKKLILSDWAVGNWRA